MNVLKNTRTRLITADEINKLQWDSACTLMLPSGFCLNYILRCSHPVIEFARIIDNVSIIIGDAPVRSFPGAALVVYTMMHYPEHYAQNMLVIPFSSIKVHGSHQKVMFIITAHEYSATSLSGYTALWHNKMEEFVPKSLAAIVLEYTDGLYQHRMIDLSLYVMTKVNGFRHNNEDLEPHMPSILTGVAIDTIPCQRPCLYVIPVCRPIVQICVAIWEDGTFPKFRPWLSSLTLKLPGEEAVVYCDRTALIADKLSHGIALCRNIYTITFMNPKGLFRTPHTIYPHEPLPNNYSCTPNTTPGALRLEVKPGTPSRTTIAVWTVTTGHVIRIHSNDEYREYYGPLPDGGM